VCACDPASHYSLLVAARGASARAALLQTRAASAADGGGGGAAAARGGASSAGGGAAAGGEAAAAAAATRATPPPPGGLDVYYWDGLDNQREPIRLTVRPNADGVALPDLDDEHELIPPLDLVLRTKWAGCLVDWNGSEPIL